MTAPASEMVEHVARAILKAQLVKLAKANGFAIPEGVIDEDVATYPTDRPTVWAEIVADARAAIKAVSVALGDAQ